jgi:predicted HTH domain antitoxin
MESAMEELKMLSPLEKYILMLLYAGGGAKGQLWLQKEVFVLSRAFEELAEEVDFEAFSYGPYSEVVEECRNALENSGLVRGTSLTEEGRIIAAMLWEAAPEQEKEIIKATAEFFESLSREELLLYICVMYPNMIEKSREMDRILERREKIALKMLRDEKVSLSLAAMLAGLSVEEMMEMALRYDINPLS